MNHTPATAHTQRQQQNNQNQNLPDRNTYAEEFQSGESLLDRVIEQAADAHVQRQRDSHDGTLVVTGVYRVVYVYVRRWADAIGLPPKGRVLRSCWVSALSHVYQVEPRCHEALEMCGI